MLVRLPLWLCQNIAIEHGPVEIVGFPMKEMVMFQSYVNVYQRLRSEEKNATQFMMS